MVRQNAMEIEVERRERIIAPLPLVWDEIDSLDGARAAARFHLTWGPLKWPLDVDVSMTLTAVGASETGSIVEATWSPGTVWRPTCGHLPRGCRTTRAAHGRQREGAGEQRRLAEELLLP